MQASTSKSLESLRSHGRQCTSVVCVMKRCSSQGAIVNHVKPILINIKYKKMEIRRVGQSPLCLPHVKLTDRIIQIIRAKVDSHVKKRHRMTILEYNEAHMQSRNMRWLRCFFGDLISTNKGVRVKKGGRLVLKSLLDGARALCTSAHSASSLTSGSSRYQPWS